MRISLEGEMLGLVTLRGRHPHKLLRLGMRASASERLRLDLCRDDFGLYLVEAAVVGRPLGPALRLVDATERAQCPRPSRCGEWKRERLPALRLQSPTLGCEPRRGCGIACPELHPHTLERGDIREQDATATLLEHSPVFGEDRSSLVESAQHRQAPGAVRTEEVVPSSLRLVFVQP